MAIIDETDYPYTIYKSKDGDELLDAHNDIIAVFNTHTEPEIERLVAAAPELLDAVVNLLYYARGTIAYESYRGPDETWRAAIEVHEDVKEAEALLRRINGEEG